MIQFHCQRNYENKSCCLTQCDHCKLYYDPFMKDTIYGPPKGEGMEPYPDEFDKNVKCTFGLTPKLIETIEKRLKEIGYSNYHSWIKIAGEVGWEPLTLCVYYLDYIKNKK